MKFAVTAVLISMALFLTGCPSAPPAPSAQPVAPKPQEVKPTPVPEKPVAPQVVPNALTASDYGPAENAISQAEAAQAERYSPTMLARAKEELKQAHSLGQSDPEKARILLSEAVTDANTARDNALAARRAAMMARLDRARQLIVDLKGDKFYPAEFQKDDALRLAAEKELQTNVDQGEAQGGTALEALVKLYDKVSQNLDTAKQKKGAAQKAIHAAEQAQAMIWVPDLLQKAGDSFLQGVVSYRSYHLEAALEAWTQAEFQAQQAQNAALTQNQKKNAEALMKATMQKIEKASQATVVTPEDQIIGPRPWNGQKALDAAPPAEATPSPAPATSPLPTPNPSQGHSELIPHDGSTVVLAEKSRLDYLEEAKTTWEKGVSFYKGGNYVLASQYFLDAQRLVDIYLEMAVDKVYTVRLIPAHRDSLWRIAGYPNIYSRPLDWPKIWKRNQKLIQNPDLIYPGWQLIIPPQ
ncbi:MAG: DUF4398 domain-containing protein [Spirochaetales bacterium]|nr:DUF4398 domain-containing protein [Spirochaetales bacterium]